MPLVLIYLGEYAQQLHDVSSISESDSFYFILRPCSVSELRLTLFAIN